MNLSEVDRELERGPTLYYWEVPGVAAGYCEDPSWCGTMRWFYEVTQNSLPLTSLISLMDNRMRLMIEEKYLKEEPNV